ncbi:galactan beta-1,4-galactosyltransferase GALS3-like [Impatiens glandulifera]|uniref:galactan beta-1,4-galactosyltransferase GALS3-like n=1 Tax=Impatiens glandulifera TaxID=253017 RepID=UPI001FB1078E|nr:galactan beta-1,4-galactosyltransferase GALS3-like [Impatiens glandulifera]
MGKEKEREKDQKKMFIGIAWNCAAELKFLVTSVLFICALVTTLQVLSSRFPLYSSSSDIRNCLSTAPPITTATIDLALSPPPSFPSPPPPPPPRQTDQILDGGIIKRAFNPIGAAAYNFILMSAYRGGLNTFAVTGLASKPLHVFGKPTYLCQWLPRHNATAQPPITTSGVRILPDWGYGRVYTVVVINCTFSVPVGHDGSGGSLLLHASTNGGGDRIMNSTDTFEALIEEPGSMKPSYFTSPPKYDYLYCGSSLYGNLSPQRVREWLAYHIRLLGGKSHFVIHDAGGVHPEVMEVLRPWMEKGYVTLQDIKEQERFDGYYHNQFLIVNDCLHRYRFDTKWMFFFDVDEFIFVPGKNTLRSVLNSLSTYTQFTIEQMTISSKLCLSEDAGKTSRKWGIEKLVYRDMKKGIRRDRKYAIQPSNVLATGVHMSQNLVAGSKTTHKTEGRIRYFHYHGTIANRREPCRQLVNATDITVEGVPYSVDMTMRSVAGAVKRFELNTIGPALQRTRQ